MKFHVSLPKFGEYLVKKIFKKVQNFQGLLETFKVLSQNWKIPNFPCKIPSFFSLILKIHISQNFFTPILFLRTDSADMKSICLNDFWAFWLLISAQSRRRSTGFQNEKEHHDNA